MAHVGDEVEEVAKGPVDEASLELLAIELGEPAECPNHRHVFGAADPLPEVTAHLTPPAQRRAGLMVCRRAGKRGAGVDTSRNLRAAALYDLLWRRTRAEAAVSCGCKVGSPPCSALLTWFETCIMFPLSKPRAMTRVHTSAIWRGLLQ